MPYRRRYTKRRPTRKKRTYKKRVKRVYPKKRRYKPNMVSLPRQILPRRGFAVHECVRYIRIPSRLASTTPPTPVNANWQMPNWGTPSATSTPFNTLFISCNDPMAPFNEVGVPNIVTPGASNWPAPNTPAFLCAVSSDTGERLTESQALFDTAPLGGGDVPPSGSNTGYRNFYGSFWQKMKAFYEKYTVVGSEAHLSFYPDPVYSVEYARDASKHCMFTMGVVPTRDAAFVETSQQAQAFTEQPGFITREFHGRTQSNGRSAAFTMKRKWSAKRDMGLSKGNIVGNNAITGDALAPYTQLPCGINAPNQWSVTATTTDVQEVTEEFAKHPSQQNWFAFSGNSLLTNNTAPGAYEKAEWPSGLIKIKIRYATVWSDPRFVNNELI